MHRLVALLLLSCLRERPLPGLQEPGRSGGHISKDAIPRTTKAHLNLALCFLNSLHLCSLILSARPCEADPLYTQKQETDGYLNVSDGNRFCLRHGWEEEMPPSLYLGLCLSLYFVQKKRMSSRKTPILEGSALRLKIGWCNWGCCGRRGSGSPPLLLLRPVYIHKLTFPTRLPTHLYWVL